VGGTDAIAVEALAPGPASHVLYTKDTQPYRIFSPNTLNPKTLPIVTDKRLGFWVWHLTCGLISR